MTSFPDLRPLRILVIRSRYIGDTILAVPALKNLRSAFPKARIEVLVEPHSGDVLAPCPLVDELIRWRPRARKGRPKEPGVLIGLLGPARWLRARRYDRCYVLRRSFSSALLPFFARIPHRVGFATEGRGWLLHRSTPYPTDKHEVECFLSVLRADGIPIADTTNAGWSLPADDALVAQDLPAGGRRRVFMCTRSSNSLKEWRPERFAAVARWLIEERQAEIHICDAPSHADYYAQIRDGLPAPARAHWHDWSLRLSLPATHALLRRMDLLVGVDTGLVHMAAGFHVPVAVLMEPWMTVRWHPWDTRHELVIARDGAKPPVFDSIEPADVQAAVDRLLSAAAAERP